MGWWVGVGGSLGVGRYVEGGEAAGDAALRRTAVAFLLETPQAVARGPLQLRAQPARLVRAGPWTLPCAPLAQSRLRSAPVPHLQAWGWSRSLLGRPVPLPFLAPSGSPPHRPPSSLFCGRFRAAYVSPGPAPTEDHVSWACDLSDHVTQWPVRLGGDRREHLPVGGRRRCKTKVVASGLLAVG